MPAKSAIGRATLSSRRRLDYLDSIRALAALGVAYLHAAMDLLPGAHGMQQKFLYVTTTAIDPGKIGVVAFFMVSGFVVPISLKASAPLGTAVKDFLMGRVFRLYPAYWLSLICAFFIFDKGSFAVCSVGRLLLNVTMFQQFFGGTSINLMGLYWTLQIEWIFYIVCIVLFARGWLTEPVRLFQTFTLSLAGAFLLAWLRFKTQHALPVAAPLGLCVMLAGSLWRMAVLEQRPEAVRYMRLAIGSFLLAIPFIARLAYTDGWRRSTLVYWIAVIGFCLLTSRLKISSRPLAALGRASFSLYLLNPFCNEFLKHVVPNRYATSQPLLDLLASAVLACLVSLPLFKYLENPCIRLGKTLARKLDRPGPDTVSETATQYV